MPETGPCPRSTLLMIACRACGSVGSDCSSRYVGSFRSPVLGHFTPGTFAVNQASQPGSVPGGVMRSRPRRHTSDTGAQICSWTGLSRWAGRWLPTRGLMQLRHSFAAANAPASGC
jgi:hypothetical protein